MALSLKYLSEEERTEWRDLLNHALNGSRQANAAAIDRAVAAIQQADRAGRAWPDLLREQMVRDGLRSALKAFAKAESETTVNYNGTPLIKAARRGVRVTAADGSTSFVQKLLWDMTWQEIGAWSDSNEAQIRGLLSNRDMARKLEDLHRMVPRSTGPLDAAAQLGTTVEEVLAA